MAASRLSVCFVAGIKQVKLWLLAIPAGGGRFPVLMNLSHLPLLELLSVSVRTFFFLHGTGINAGEKKKPLSSEIKIYTEVLISLI